MFKMGKIDPRASVSLPTESDRGARFFVWSVWLLMMLVVLFCLVKYSLNIPYYEDWYFVPAMTGNEANLLDWLWSQNNEHRVPLPRLILLALLKATAGDFRTGMLLNVILTGALAAAMILVARSIRGSRTRYSDALFPIVRSGSRIVGDSELAQWLPKPNAVDFRAGAAEAAGSSRSTGEISQ